MSDALDVLLSRPYLRHDDADSRILADLQCNTLAPHRRNLAVFLFFRLGPDASRNLDYLEAWGERASSLLDQIAVEGDRREKLQTAVSQAMMAQPWLARMTESFAPGLVGAWHQQARALRSRAIRDFRTTSASRRPLLRSVMLTRAGRDQLGPAWGSHLILKDAFWEAGMKASEADLALNPTDPDAATAGWDPLFQQPAGREIHLMVMLALDGAEVNGRARPKPPAELFAAVAEEKQRIAAIGGAFLGRRWGYRRPHPQGGDIEHFGFRDGISNPAGVDTEASAAQFGTTLRNFLLPLAMPDGTRVPASCVVFRQIEQRVDAFAALASQEQADLVGRHPDGTPLAAAKGGPNDFDYDNDPGSPDDQGRTRAPACPFHAHIRKSNPRRSSPLGAAETSVLFGRRGLLYGQRAFAPDTGRLGALSRGTQAVGLLFVGCMGSIQHQFAFMQRSWLDSPEFPKHHPPPAGLDRIAGLSPAGAAAGHTRVRGGEYFLVPPRPWLRAVKQFPSA